MISVDNRSSSHRIEYMAFILNRYIMPTIKSGSIYYTGVWMSLVESCLKGDEAGAVQALLDMLPRAQPSAMWAILMHAASWHEQMTYDTPHSTILTFAIHRMIESLGPHDNLGTGESNEARLSLSRDLKKNMQMIFVERLARYLAAVDHWLPEKGPRYDVYSGVDSPGNLLRKFAQSIRERSIVGAMEGSIGLLGMDQVSRLIRMALSMAAEKPDSLGHGFIMPVSLLAELPSHKYRHPSITTLWHLVEYMVRKVPTKKTDGFFEDEQFKRLVEPTDLSKDTELIGTALVNYGILGHNGIFAHRIAYASSTGLIHNETVRWLLDKLKKNIGTKVMTTSQLETDWLIKTKKVSDWGSEPGLVGLPHSSPTLTWMESNLDDVWSAMLDAKGNTFAHMILSLSKNDWQLVRAAQYAISALYGKPRSSHTLIFTQSAWGLVDLGLVSNDIAALQVHRMIREHLLTDGMS